MKNNHIDSVERILIGVEVYTLSEGKVLMHRRAETAKKFPGYWVGPGGHIDYGEDALTAAIREVEEETGVVIGEHDIKLKVIALHHHLDKDELWMAFIFRAVIPAFQATHGGTDEGTAEWIPIDQLTSTDKVFPAAAYYFGHVFEDSPGIMYTSIEWENAQLKRILSEKIDRDT